MNQNDDLCARYTKARIIDCAHAWLTSACARGINIHADPDGYLAVIHGLLMEIERQDRRLAYVEPIYRAARELVDNAEEYECEGLGLWAQHGWWEPLHDALDPDGPEADDDIRQPVSPAK